MDVQLLTPDERGEYLERVRHDIARADYFVLITAFATSDGITLLEPAMRRCLEAHGQGTIVLALDRQHFNASEVFRKLAELAKSFPTRLEVRIVHERSGLLHAKALFARFPDGNATLLVGSANLTKRAFMQNHELGLWVDLLDKPEVSRAFQRFAHSLGGARYDADGLLDLARHLKAAGQWPKTARVQRKTECCWASSSSSASPGIPDPTDRARRYIRWRLAPCR